MKSCVCLQTELCEAWRPPEISSGGSGASVRELLHQSQERPVKPRAEIESRAFLLRFQCLGAILCGSDFQSLTVWPPSRPHSRLSLEVKEEGGFWRDRDAPPPYDGRRPDQTFDMGAWDGRLQGKVGSQDPEITLGTGKGGS